MDSQDHRKNHTQGHDSHGVHLCHKCGWPFPNPHPSARHRRAHKKICGTIEGYKLIESPESAHLNVSDDEHLSDEDHNTPSPKVLERSNNERGSGGIGDRSKGSEDEVFADAVTEFADSGSSVAIEEHLKEVKGPAANVETTAEDDSTTSHSYKDGGATTAIIPPAINSTDNSQMQSTEVSGSILSGSQKESQDHVSRVNIDLTERSLTEQRTEESPCELSDDKGGSSGDISSIKLERKIDASKENSNAGEDLARIDAQGDEETNLGKHSLDVIPPSGDAGIELEAASELRKTEDITSDLAPAAGIVQSTEERMFELGCKMPSNDISHEVEYVQDMNNSFDASQIKVDGFQGLVATNFDSSTQNYNGKEENENVHVLSVPNEITVVDNAELMIKGFKDHTGKKLPQFVNVESLELISDVKGSALRNIPSSFHSKLSDEGAEVSVLQKDDLKDQKYASNELIVEGLPDEGGTDIPQNKAIVDENQKSEEFGFLDNSLEVDKEQEYTVPPPEEQLSNNYCDNPSLTSYATYTAEVLSEGNPVVMPMYAEARHASDLVGLEATGNIDEVGTGEYEAIANDFNRVTVEGFTENIMAISEPQSALSEIDINARTNLHRDNSAPDKEEGKTRRCDIPSIESREGDSGLGSVEENPSVETKTTPESASDLCESLVCEGDINETDRKLPENEFLHLGKVSDSLPEKGSGDDKIQVECVGQTSTVAESDNTPNDEPESHVVLGDDINMHQRKPAETECSNLGAVLDTQGSRKELVIDGSDKAKVECEVSKGGEVEVPNKSAENQRTEGPLISSLDISSSILNSPMVDNNHDTDFTGAASGDKIQSIPDEGDNNIYAQQLCASAADFSVDSSSQTDSLEGHWGSVSVLSMQSDVQAIVDAEPLLSNGLQASADAEKKPKAASEGQHSDKSDMFEPPSFMTLVEPRGGVDQNAAASEIQTVQKQQQPNAASLQAGWFPSLTHVVNESQGRKKNEEIIAKVTNWSSGKQHTPLKNLLGEASVETKLKSANVKENPPPAGQKDETILKDNDTMVTTVSSIMGPQAPKAEPAKKEAGKEWNSPARYPADIKREKRKVKGRPYWAQFVCCSSVN